VRTQLSYINFKLAKVLGFHLTFLSSFEVSICLSMAKHVRQPTVRSVQPFVRYSPRDEAMKKVRCAKYRDQASCSNSGSGRTQTLGPLLTRTSIGAVPTTELMPSNFGCNALLAGLALVVLRWGWGPLAPKRGGTHRCIGGRAQITNLHWLFQSREEWTQDRRPANCTRLNIVTVHLAPLRERRDDILPLADYFRKSANKKNGKQTKSSWKFQFLEELALYK